MNETGTQARVLIADDDPLIRRLLAKLVRREGMIADTAADGVGALALLAENNYRYHAILLDLMMPRLNGYDVVDHLGSRVDEPRPIVIVITAYGDDEWHDLNPAVVTGVVRKPFEISDLGNLLRLCIDRSASPSLWSSIPSLRLLRQQSS